MVNDISKNVVLVMLVLAIVISVTGTWLVLDNIDKAEISVDMSQLQTDISQLEGVNNVNIVELKAG